MSAHVRRLAHSIRTAAVRSAAAAPVSRGADWHRVTISSVASDGTVGVTLADGSTIAKVRRQGYDMAQVGDVAVMHRSANGNRYLTAPLSTSAAGWQALTLTSSWTVYGGDAAPNVRCRLVSGNVQLQGWIQCTNWNASSVVCTMPAGFRPAQSVSLPCSDPGDHQTVWEVQINAAGTVTAHTPSQPSGLFMSLDNIIYSLT